MQFRASMQSYEDDWSDMNRQALESGNDLEFSLVELVLAASECSEDEMEVQDLVDGLIDCGQVQLDGI
jgi:hypothetical protein